MTQELTEMIGRAIVAASIFWGGAWIAWSGIRPSRSDSKKWYDRTIRIVGGLMLMAVAIGGVIALGLSRTQ